MMDYKIYCVYHNINLIDEYNLKETNNLKLYFTHSEDDAKYNLNYAQLHFNEWVAQYYIYKNNIKSDIVGFCHYNRKLDKYINIDDDLLNYIYNNSQYYSFIFNVYSDSSLIKEFHITGLGYHVELYKNYIKERYGSFYYKRYIKLISSPWYTQSYRELYLCKWDVFCNLCSFIEGYVKYLFKHALNIDEKELCKYSLENYKQLDNFLNDRNWHIKNKYNKDNNLDPIDYYFGSPRCIGFMIEFYTGVFFELFYSNKNF